MSAENILERAIAVAAGGLKNPAMVLVEVAKTSTDSEDGKAWLAAYKVAGMPLAAWYGLAGAGRSVADTVRLFEDALFEVQVGGV